MIYSRIENSGNALNIYASNPLFRFLLDKGKVVEDGGTAIQMPITYAKIGAAGTFNKYSLLDTLPNNTDTAASWNWKFNYAHVIVSKTELALNSGKSQAVNLLKSKTRNAMQAIKDNCGTQAFSTNGDSDQGLNGLRQTIKATGIAGGINQSDFSGWASDIDAATSALTISAMEAGFLDASIGYDEPDIIVTTKGVYKKYYALLQASQRFAASEVGAAGFRYLLFNSVPIFHDSHVPGSGASTADNHMFMINSRWMYLYVHKDMNMEVEKVGILPTQHAHMDRVVFGANLVTDNRRMHAAFTVLKH